MKNLSKPQINGTEVLSHCIDSKKFRLNKNKNLIPRLESIVGVVQIAEEIYDNLGEEASLYRIETSNSVDTVTKDEMVSLYEDTMLKNDAARAIYDQIKMSPKHGICPFCSQRTVSTLDHYLPKADHPVYAVSPINLLPSCQDCNTSKHTYKAEEKKDQLIHPYYDDTNDGRWLYAEIVETNPPGIIYSVIPPEDWTEEKSFRVQNQFDILDLGTLYSSNAGAELAGYCNTLRKLYYKGGANLVRQRLEEDAESWFESHRNSWKGALFDVLCSSDWFCEEWISQQDEL